MSSGAADRKRSGGKQKNARAPTEFEERVYDKCTKIPAGKVASYGVLAASLEGGGCPRSVGGAMKRNPYAPYVP